MSFVLVRLFSVFIAVILGATTVFAAPAIPPAAPTQVCSAIVYDMNHEAILFEQNADEHIPPASLTKVMSMFLAMDFIGNGHASLTTPVAVSALSAAQGGSRMGLRAEESVSLGKLLLGMAVSSGNDASHAVAEYVGGSEAAFVRMMNARAAAIGMADTRFANPHGLPHAEQHTTARDMLTLARAYLKAHPEALDFHNTLILEHGGYKTWNKNPLIGQYPGADGLKTGWIRASGYNLIFTATRGERRLLAVIMGAPDVATRGAEACRLLDAGFMVCDNDAVSVTAALDGIACDYGRIDPRKTAREAGIYKARALAARKSVAGKRQLVAKKSMGKGNFTQNGRARVSAKTERQLAQRKNARAVTQRKAATKTRIHAETRARSRRG